MVLPSGLTSTEIQVPLLVVKLTFLVGSKGSSLVAFFIESLTLEVS